MNLYDLDEQLLNVWVAKAEGHMIATIKQGTEIVGYSLYYHSGDTPRIPDYCGDPEVSDHIIALEGITTIHLPTFNEHYAWRATHPELEGSRGGTTELKAAMRAYVASKYGNELPEEI
jgi:hypothetical protein